jgi:hypothetical protein
MRRQVPQAPQPIPVLLARPDADAGPGQCVSCADPWLETIRCPLCALAAWIACANYQGQVLS